MLNLQIFFLQMFFETFSKQSKMYRSKNKTHFVAMMMQQKMNMQQQNYYNQQTQNMQQQQQPMSDSTGNNFPQHNSNNVPQYQSNLQNNNESSVDKGRIFFFFFEIHISLFFHHMHVQTYVRAKNNIQKHKKIIKKRTK